MTSWILMLVLLSLFNSFCIVYWQRANERRMDIHNQRLEAQKSWLLRHDYKIDALELKK